MTYLYCQSCGEYLGSLGGNSCNICGWNDSDHEDENCFKGASDEAENLKAEIEHLQAIIELQAVAMRSLIRKPMTSEAIDKMFGSNPPSLYVGDMKRKRNLEIYYFGVRDAEAFHDIK